MFYKGRLSVPHTILVTSSSNVPYATELEDDVLLLVHKVQPLLVLLVPVRSC